MMGEEEELYKARVKAWGEWVNQGGDVGEEDKEKEEQSFEYMRRKLWCDMVMSHNNSGQPMSMVLSAANLVLQEIDERFGKKDVE